MDYGGISFRVNDVGIDAFWRVFFFFFFQFKLVHVSA